MRSKERGGEEYEFEEEDIAMKNIFDYGDGKVGLYR